MELAKYSLIFPSKNGKGAFFWNTLTNSIVRLDEEHYQAFLSLDGRDDKGVLAFLKSHGFLSSEEDTREILERKRSLLFEKKDISTLCVFTSFRCNFRCPYCYESHLDEALSEESYQTLIALVKKEKPRILFLSWFGGEPLLYPSKIIETNTILKSFQTGRGSFFKSGITTNASLLDQDVFGRLISSGVTDYQITLDGVKKDNDQTRVYQNGNGSFERISKNLLAMKRTAFDFRTVIRCNASPSTDIDAFADYFKANFADDKRFSLLFFPVCDWKNIHMETSCSPSKERRDLFSMNEVVLKKHLSSALYSSVEFDGFSCQFGYPGKCVVYPDGATGNCTIKTEAKGSLAEAWNEISYPKPHYCSNESCFLYPKCFGMQCRYKTINEASCESLRKSVLSFMTLYFQEYGQ